MYSWKNSSWHPEAHIMEKTIFSLNLVFCFLFAIVCHEQFQCTLNVHVNKQINVMLHKTGIFSIFILWWDLNLFLLCQSFPALPGHFCGFQLEQIESSCNLRQLIIGNSPAWSWWIHKTKTLVCCEISECSIGCNIYTFQRDTQCSCTDCLLILRCQLYMFLTVTVHHQELLFRCCMCRLRYVLIRPAGTMFEEEVLPQTLCQRDVPDSAFLTTYHSLHIQYLKRSSWGWTVTARNM